MTSPADPRWTTWWEDLYTPLHIPFYASLGNHDWGFTDSPAAEILYKSSSWRMPAPYYTFTAGPVQFFALDTNDVSGAQLIWLDRQLASSKAKWRVVYGHHPIYSAGTHSDNKILIQKLLPVLRGRVDIYLAGHDHDMQHLKPEDGVHFFVAGGGGAHLRKPTPGPRSIFARGVHGFAVLNATQEGIRVDYIGLDQKPMYSYTVTK